MSRHDFLEEGMQYLNDVLEMDISTPYLIIGLSIILFIINAFILFELSKVMHGHKGSYGISSMIYYMLEVVNYIIWFKFVHHLIKAYNTLKSKTQVYIAFAFIMINPVLFSLLFF